MIIWDHNFVHVTTAQLSLHVQTCDLVRSVFLMKNQQIWLHDLDNEVISCLNNGSTNLINSQFKVLNYDTKNSQQSLYVILCHRRETLTVT